MSQLKKDEVVIIDDLSDFEDLDLEIQANIVKLEPKMTDSSNDPEEIKLNNGEIQLDKNTKLIPLENISKNSSSFPQIQVKPMLQNETKSSIRSNIIYRTSGGQRIKIVPKRTDLQNIQNNSPSGSSSEQTVPGTPTTSSQPNKANKRKSQHVLKDEMENEFQFLEGDTGDEDTRILMKNLAWLRVSINFLLDEAGMGKLYFHGRPGKSRPIAFIKKQIDKVKKAKLEEENKNKSVS